MKKRKAVVVVLAIFLCSVFACNCSAQESIVSDYPGLKPLVDFVGEEELSVLDLVGFKAADRAMKDLSFSKGDSNILVLTDAGYIAKIGDYTTEKALDGVILTSGLSRGKGNLANLHKPYNSPLWFAFFDNRSKDCVYLEADSEVLKTYLDREKRERDGALMDFMKLKDEEIFTRIAKENIDADKLLNEPEAWQEKMVAKVFGGNEFSIFTISNLWAMGLPNDFLKAAELHDHICPGLTSGYLIAKYLIENFPPTGYPKEEWIIIAIPSWCKDDVLIQMFETNVGHKRMYVKYIAPEQQKALPENIRGKTADIVVNTKTGKGILVGFDWDKAYTGTKPSDVELKDYQAWLKHFDTWHWWWTRLKMDIWMVDYYDKPEELVFTIKEFEAKDELSWENLSKAGVNPLVELGIMPEPGKTPPPTPAPTKEAPSIPGLAVIAAIAIAGALVYASRRRKYMTR